MTKEHKKRLKEVNSITKKIDEIQDMNDRVQEISEKICKHIYSKEGYLIDMQNYSIMSITEPSELY